MNDLSLNVFGLIALWLSGVSIGMGIVLIAWRKR